MLQQPEAVEHHGEQHEVGLAEIEHVEHERHVAKPGKENSHGPGVRPDPVIACESCAVIHHATAFSTDRQR